MKRPWSLAWTCTIAALILAISPGLTAILRGRIATYDPGLAVLTATLIAIIWYTCFTFESLELARSRDENARERDRRVLAAGLFEEVTRLEGTLKRLSDEGTAARYYSLDHPLLTHAMGQASVLSAEAVAALVAFHGRLRNAEIAIEEFYKRRPSGEDLKSLDRDVRSLATETLAVLPRFFKALAIERGSGSIAVKPGMNGEGRVTEAKDP